MIASPTSIVRVDGLTKRYLPSNRWMRLLVKSMIEHEVLALDDVSFEVGPGEVCALVGPNGAGKTTVFRILVGLTTASSGSAEVLGMDCDRDAVAIRRRVGWMPSEERSLHMRLTCTQNLAFHGRLHGFGGSELQRRIDRTLAEVGLGDQRNDAVVSLSAGMRSRLQLGRALLHDPRVLILDEPTGSVDPVAAHELLGIITTAVGERQMAALISSHRLEEIEALRSHVVILDKGRTRFDGDLDTLRRQWGTPRLQLVFTSAESARRAVDAIAALDGPPAEADGAVVSCDPDAGVGRVVEVLGSLRGDLVGVHESTTPLRDVLARMYHHQGAP